MPRKSFVIQAKLGAKWEFVKKELTLAGAYQYLSTRRSHSYPFRIIRVVRTVVFEEE